MALTAKAAADLATSYHAYLVAVAAKDDLGVVIWGQTLLTDQAATGVAMSDPTLINDLVTYSRRRLERASLAQLLAR